MKHYKFFLVIIFYFVLAFVLYSPLTTAFFVSDDFQWLWRAKTTPLTFENYFLRNSDNQAGQGAYRPLTLFSFWFNYQLADLNPVFYRLTNLFFFVAGVSLIFWLVWLLSQRIGAAWLSGLIFLVLPNHPEAVSWLSGRGDVLTAFFYLLAIILYIYFRRQRRIIWLFFSLISFWLALWSKEMAITLPMILLIYELLWHWPEKSKRLSELGFLALRLLPFAAALTIFLIIRWAATDQVVGYYASNTLRLDWRHWVRELAAIVMSNFTGVLHRLIWQQFILHYWYLFGGLFAAGLFFLFLKAKSHRRFIFFGLAWLVIGALPVLPLNSVNLTDEGERFAYVSSIGAAILLSALMIWLWDKQRLAVQVFLSAAAALLLWQSAVQLYQKNLFWQAGAELSQSLLKQFEVIINQYPRDGLVILGLPDNIQGAQVLRNGWLEALRLSYPSYIPDVLVVKTRFNLPSAKSADAVFNIRPLTNGYRFTSVQPLFFSGQSKLASLDYLLEIKNYDKIWQAGSAVEFQFTPLFLSQLKEKQIRFLAVSEGQIKLLPTPGANGDNSN